MSSQPERDRTNITEDNMEMETTNHNNIRTSVDSGKSQEPIFEPIASNGQPKHRLFKKASIHSSEGLAGLNRSVSSANPPVFAIGDKEILKKRRPQWTSMVSPTRLDMDDVNDLYEDEKAPGTMLSAYLRTFTPDFLTTSDETTAKTKEDKKLGLMIGVYLPTIQNVFGVIMFLRLAWIVGTAGIGATFALVSLCSLTTLLTVISLSAIVTNGVVEGGGAYFMISRNLGPEMGSAVGILFYLANTVATALYLIGAIELLLMYIAPQLMIGSAEDANDTAFTGVMTTNFRLYGTLLLLIVMAIVACGVRFVQLFAPVSLVCVIVTFVALFAGTIEKTINTDSGPKVCLLGNELLWKSAFMPPNATDVCRYCVPEVAVSYIVKTECGNDTVCVDNFNVTEFDTLKCVQSMPGLLSGEFGKNFYPSYMLHGESEPGKQQPRTRTFVTQDLTTTFFILLAIYFPSVTGIFTGANMSGDLKSPEKNIPKGTIAAQLTTSLLCLAFVCIFGAMFIGPVLKDKYGQSMGDGMVVASLTWPHPTIMIIGSFMSTFGAGLQSLCSAPRLLQCIAKDDLIPFLRPFAVVDHRNEPIRFGLDYQGFTGRGLILSTIIAELAILIGTLDHIAPVVNFFFLMCYAFINIIVTMHSLLGAPNWRPRFKYYHWSLSLLGAILCFFIMFVTYWHYAIISIILCAAIYKYVEWKGAKREWGDGIRGLALTTAQFSLQRIAEKETHPKNWRPQLLVFVKSPIDEGSGEPSAMGDEVDGEHVHDRPQHVHEGVHLLHLAHQLKAGKGLTLVASLMKGDPTRPSSRNDAAELKEEIQATMKDAHVKGFASTVIYEKGLFAASVSTLLQTSGMGGLRPNTALVGWPTDWQNLAEGPEHNTEYWDFIDTLHRGASLDMCLIVVKGLSNMPHGRDRLTGFIDIWWILHDGGLLILLAFLLQQHKVWRKCTLRLFAVAQETDNSVKMKEDLLKFVYELRIDALVEVVELSETAISAYDYERTLALETRNRVIEGIGLNAQEQEAVPHVLLERTPIPNRIPLDEESDDYCSFDNVPAASVPTHLNVEVSINPTPNNDFTFTPQSYRVMNSKMQAAQLKRKMDKKKVKKMHTAVRLNGQIKERSKDSQLVILNLPRPPRSRQGLKNYMEYMEVLTDKLDRVLLVRGTGQEVVTIYS